MPPSTARRYPAHLRAPTRRAPMNIAAAIIRLRQASRPSALVAPSHARRAHRAAWIRHRATGTECLRARLGATQPTSARPSRAPTRRAAMDIAAAIIGLHQASRRFALVAPSHARRAHRAACVRHRAAGTECRRARLGATQPTSARPSRAPTHRAAMDIAATIIDLLGQRAASASICPSEVARALRPEPGDWRPLMQPVREAAAALAREDRVVITRKSATLDPNDLGPGPIRLRRGPGFP
ncbi:DUF3253 domain-containing protein [Stenotrophomonas lacuserhaii]|uniref:DUF3253 domain-containing protein n=1 Tax=Stenotrophomonas lacuserhaii TaxID=2760084 RepID=UPI002948BB5A|nr:DUF3253 domain-containing protein [Stenotrophomonas lacuserhaii]